MSRFTRVAAGIAEGFMAARYHRALSHMNDRQLADIGLTRADIPRRALRTGAAPLSGAPKRKSFREGGGKPPFPYPPPGGTSSRGGGR